MLVPREHKKAWVVLALALSACSADKSPHDGDDTGADQGRDEGSDDQSEDEDDDEGVEDTGSKRDAASRMGAKDAASEGADKNERNIARRDAGAGAAAKDASTTPNGSSAVSPPTFASGPVDGDPNKPVVSIPEVPCGGSAGLDGFVGANFGGFPVPGTPNLKIGGRDVILTYPCNKHEGAQVTFILNLHGTMPDEGLKLYQHSYFAAHKLANSHNLIVLSPKSVVSQWGNGDEGKDLPHLYEVIDWVYEKFSKYTITGLWVGGHSWGSMFAKSFVCDDMLKGRARGLIGMSGGATGVGGVGGFLGGGAGSSECADRLSQIHTNGDLEGGESGVPDQTAAAMKHGCDARLAPMDIGEGQILYDWPNCDDGWTHFNFVMGEHQHTTPVNDPVVKFIVERVKATEKEP